MRRRLTYGDRLVLAVSVMILLFVVLSCVGAEWCRHNYYCPDKQSEKYANDCAANGVTVFYTIIYCWFHSFREDINALATSTLAFLTVILAYATTRQANLTRSAVESAKKSADVAERALIDLERPYIAVDVPDSGITVDINGGLHFFRTERTRWEAVNYGRTPALLIDRQINWLHKASGHMPDAIDPVTQRGRQFPAGCLAAENRPYTETANLMAELPDAPELLKPGGWYDRTLFFFGYIRYEDLFGGRYVHGFCLAFDPMGRQFLRIGGDTYNYTRTEKKPETSLLS